MFFARVFSRLASLVDSGEGLEAAFLAAIFSALLD